MKNQNVKTEVVETKEVKPKYEIEEVEFSDFGFEKENVENGFDEVYFVKPKTKDTAYFEFSKKVGDKILVDPRKTLKLVEGKLNKVELGSYTYENKEVKTFKLHISKEVNGKSILFIVSSSYTQIGRSILNTLLGATKPITKISLGLYNNNSGYASVTILIDGKKGVWLLSIDEQRKYIETIKNKKGEFVSNDYSELDEVLEDKMRTHLNILFPEQNHIRFVENSNDEIPAEEVFGEDDAENFFEINEEE